MASRHTLPVEVLIRRLENGLCSQCGMRTVRDDGELVEDVDGRVLQGRCLLCYPLGFTPSGDAVHVLLMTRRIDLGRCDTCEMMTRRKDGSDIDNNRTIMGRCLLCSPLGSLPPCGEVTTSTDAQSEEGIRKFHSVDDSGNLVGGRIVEECSTKTTPSVKCSGRIVQMDAAQLDENECDCNEDNKGDDNENSADFASKARSRESGTGKEGDNVQGKSGAGEEHALKNPSPPCVSRDEDPPSSKCDPSQLHSLEGSKDQATTPMFFVQAAERRKQARRRQAAKTANQIRPRKARSTSAFESVSEAIELAKSNPIDAQLQEKTVKLVKQQVNAANVEGLVAEGAIDLMLAAMENHSENIGVALECIWTLAIITWIRPVYATLIAQGGGLKSVIAMLEYDSKNTKQKKMISKHVVDALNHMMATPVAVEKFFECGGLDPLLKALRHYCKVPDIHSPGCQIMQEIILQKRGAVHTLVEAGAFHTIVLGMQNKVSEDTVIALQSFLLDDSSRLQFVKANGLDVFIPYFRQRMSKRHADKMKEAMETFHNLVSIESSSSELVEGVLVPVIQTGGIIAIQSTMQRYPANEPIQLLGLQSVDDLVFDENSAKEVINAGCMNTLIDAM